MQEYLNRGQVVCCVGWLLFLEEGKGLRSFNCKVVGEVAQVTVKSHWQEDSPVFPDITTFVSGGEGRGLGFPFLSCPAFAT